jgi:hypothetical protein
MNDTTEPMAMRISLWGREDGLVGLGTIGPDDLNTRDWKIGDKIVFEVIGIEHKTWEGVQVR